MKRRMIYSLCIGAVLCLLLAACSMPSSTPDAAATLHAIYTAQVVTPQAPGTTTAGGDGSGSQKPLPTLAFPTLPASSTPGVPAATAVPIIQATPTPAVPCDWAAFVTDVSVPDGDVVVPGAQVTKIWRLKNNGLCTWTTSYGLVFMKGNSMNATTSANLPANVAPGQTIDVSVVLTAPAIEGEYKGYWLLRNSRGVTFGVGSRASDPFWVDIQVVGPMSSVYDFSARYCDAAWSSGQGDLGCPGELNSNTGNANKVQNPKLENGQMFEGLGLLTVPENKKDGYIKGRYPALTIVRGDRFRAQINCAYNTSGCNVIFQLNYQIGDDAVKTLWQYNEVYDGQTHLVDTDLSPLAGNSVKFFLAVLSNGAAKNDQPLWINPRIERLTNLITPTVTPTMTATATMTLTPTVTLTATPHP